MWLSILLGAKHYFFYRSLSTGGNFCLIVYGEEIKLSENKISLSFRESNNKKVINNLLFKYCSLKENFKEYIYSKFFKNFEKNSFHRKFLFIGNF